MFYLDFKKNSSQKHTLMTASFCWDLIQTIKNGFTKSEYNLFSPQLKVRLIFFVKIGIKRSLKVEISVKWVGIYKMGY